VFPDWSDERFPLYVYYASRNYVPAKVRTFIDFIVDSLKMQTGTAFKYNSSSTDKAKVTIEAARQT
jgi:hypothetical protein